MLKYLYLIKNIFKECFYYLYYRDINRFIRNNIHEISKINMLYIKLFQSMANNYWINETINNNIVKYTNDVPYNEEDIDYELINQLKIQYNLTYNDLKPINSGLISLIFKVKKDEEDIILKIKRKNIDVNIHKSIEELSYVIYILDIIPFIKNIKIKHFFHKNIHLLKEQLDFDTEVKNIGLFQEIFKNIDYVVVPKVYNYVTMNYPNVIMMKYIHGKQIQAVNNELNETYSKIIIKISIISYLAGVIHGDLHSGNVLFLDNDIPQVCLLDFGIVLKINKDGIKSIMTIIDELYEKTAYELSINLLSIIVNNFKELYKPEFKDHMDNLLKILSDIIINVQMKSTKYNIYNYFECIQSVIKYINKNQLYKYNIVLNDDFYHLNFIFFMASGIVSKLCSKELFFIMNDVCKELFHTDLL